MAQDNTENKAYARSTDPQTSWDAADTIDVTETQRMVLDVMTRMEHDDPRPHTSQEIIEACRKQRGYQYAESTIRTRINELQINGLVSRADGNGLSANGHRCSRYLTRPDHARHTTPVETVDEIPEGLTGDDRLIDTNRLAMMLGVSPKTIRNKRVSRTLGIPYIKMGRTIRYRVRDVKQYIENHRKPGEEPHEMSPSRIMSPTLTEEEYAAYSDQIARYRAGRRKAKGIRHA